MCFYRKQALTLISESRSLQYDLTRHLATFVTHNLIDCNPRHSRRVSFLCQIVVLRKKKKDHFALLSPLQNSCFSHILKSCLFSNISCSLEPFSLHRKTILWFRSRFYYFWHFEFQRQNGPFFWLLFLFLLLFTILLWDKDDCLFFNKHAWAKTKTKQKQKTMYFLSVCTSSCIIEGKIAWF